MEFKDLENIQRESQDELYDLTSLYFQYKQDVLDQFEQVYIVESYDEMRLDIVCYNIYGSTDYVDFLCDLNNISNPLNIKGGTEIIYVPDNIIASFRPERSDTKVVRDKINNARKQTKVDPNRKKYNEEKSQSLPPTVTKKDYVPVKYRDGKIRIGENIFNT